MAKNYKEKGKNFNIFLSSNDFLKNDSKVGKINVEEKNV